jgi:hypothetical protein
LEGNLAFCEYCEYLKLMTIWAYLASYSLSRSMQFLRKILICLIGSL